MGGYSGSMEEDKGGGGTILVRDLEGMFKNAGPSQGNRGGI